MLLHFAHLGLGRALISYNRYTEKNNLIIFLCLSIVRYQWSGHEVVTREFEFPQGNYNPINYSQSAHGLIYRHPLLQLHLWNGKNYIYILIRSDPLCETVFYNA